MDPQSSKKADKTTRFSGTGTGGSRWAAGDRWPAANNQPGAQQQDMQLRGSAAMKRVVAARNHVLTPNEKSRKSGDDAVAKGQEGI